MRAIYSYGIALVFLIVIAVWLGTGTLVTGGNGPGNGEKPVVALLEKNGGPLTDAVTKSGINDAHESETTVDPKLSIAERNDKNGNGKQSTPRSVRIAIMTAKNMPIEVPLRGRTRASSSVSVVAQTVGTVQTVKVTKGQQVKPGDILCTLDTGARQLAVNQAKAALDQAQSAFDSNKALVNKGLAASNTALAAQSGLATAQTALEQAQLELDRATIKTDVAGVVEDPVAKIGSMLGAGTPCATVVQLDPMLFVGSVPEAQMKYARTGLTAEITTITGDKAAGKVTYIAATADDATRSFPVEIEIPNGDGKLRDGVTAEAIVQVGTAPVQILPQSALTLDDNGVLGIRTVEDGNKVAFHAITILKDTREGIWVVGLPSTIELITVGQEFVQAGQTVDASTGEAPVTNSDASSSTEGAQS